VLGLFLLIAIVVMFGQIRGGRLAMPLALPAAGWLIAGARRRYLSSRRLADALRMVGGWLGFAGVLIGIVLLLATRPFGGSAAQAANADTAACRMPASFANLARLPPARIMAPIDLGSHLLLFTPHSVVAAPYQRDQAGLLDAFHFFDGPIGNARQILAARGVSLVVICPGMPELAASNGAPDSFVALLAKRQLPSWLDRISAPGDVLQVYRVAP